MSASPTLVTELKAQVLRLEDDLRARVQSQPDVLQRWQDEHRAATRADRTASSWVEWRDDRVTQAAVAWVLATVFIRFCEDNRLLSKVWISGPPERRQEAMDAQNAYFRAHPTDTDREWLGQAIDHLRATPATRSLVEDHSPLWTVSPSGTAVAALLSFWRERGEDGALLRDLADPDLSTRFLGDLYQDLSEHAKKTYALLQTPEFVEEFILDQTMEPALAERPLDGFRLIDPACGSGHFLLGAFSRLLRRWDRHAPALEPRERIQRCLDAVAGVDLNPFAVAITRFRLTLAALQALGETSMERAPGFTYSVLAGDSLLFGHSQTELGFGDTVEVGGFAYSSEDRDALDALLAPGQYDVVVGNPPYITINDPSVNQAYRRLYPSCYQSYALTVPFMEQFFRLGKPARDGALSGWIGQITSNSFMTRRFGRRLVERFLPRIDLRAVIDCEGAWIPGHNTDGTPTVILIGRSQEATSLRVRMVLGKGRRESRTESGLGSGPLWRSIVEHVGEPSFENDWLSVVDKDRDYLASHPWSLSGGGADQLRALLEGAPSTLQDVVSEVGFSAVTREDSAYMLGRDVLRRHRTPLEHRRPITEGAPIRDWTFTSSVDSVWPYDPESLEPRLDGATEKILWPFRVILSSRVAYGKTQLERKLQWYEYSMFFKRRFDARRVWGLASIASHNHFAPAPERSVFKDTALVVILPPSMSNEEYMSLLGLANSSCACFWLKQVCKPKGGAAGVPWLRTYQFNAENVSRLPVPSGVHSPRVQSLTLLSAQASALEPSSQCADILPSKAALDSARGEWEACVRQQIALQEELDWDVYRAFGVVEDLTYMGDDLPELAPGQRAFEIALARKVSAGDLETEWFIRHGSQPITEVPSSWPAGYREVVERRLDLIESDRFIGLLERPEYKRRWASEPWEKQQEVALRDWLLDRLEDRSFWFDRSGRPSPQSVGQLADRVAHDADLVSVLGLWEGRPDVPLATSLTRLLADGAVHYLAAYRLNDSGLRKREVWEHTWALQRREDAGERIGTIPIPPKYEATDFRKPSYWHARGELDVAKERFISYPGAGRATDPTPLLGWAGWDHAEQALALAMILAARESEGADGEVLVPLVAGLAELQPWVEQWHATVDEAYGMSLAEFCREELATRARQVNRSLDQLRDWRPAPAARGRRARV